MSKRIVSFDAVTHVRREVGDDGWGALMDPTNLQFVQRFTQGLVRRASHLLLPVPLSDEEAVARFVHLAEKVVAWRSYAMAMGYTGPVVWLARAGFTLKKHAPKAGPCYESLKYLQGWPIRNDEETSDSAVFWVPRLVADSTGKMSSEMEVLRSELRQRHNLPENHCDRFGHIALIFALILAHYKRTGERVPLNYLYAASDTFHGDGHRLIAGRFRADGLDCSYWSGSARAYVGFLLLGVETLGNS